MDHHPDEQDTGLTRRKLLRLGAVSGTAGLAGCTVNVGGYEFSIEGSGGGYEFSFGETGGESSTPTVGYGGTPTPGSKPAQTPSDSPTPTPDVSSASTPEETSTLTPEPDRDYGLLGYGEYGYGGVAP